eukprot:17815-Heterococcus_DN1.PRE.3
MQAQRRAVIANLRHLAAENFENRAEIAKLDSDAYEQASDKLNGVFEDVRHTITLVHDTRTLGQLTVYGGMQHCTLCTLCKRCYKPARKQCVTHYIKVTERVAVMLNTLCQWLMQEVKQRQVRKPKPKDDGSAPVVVPALITTNKKEKDAQELRLIALRKALAKQHAAHPDKEMLDFSVLINPNSFTQ